MSTKTIKNDVGSHLVGRGARILIQANGREKTVEMLLDLIEEILEGHK